MRPRSNLHTHTTFSDGSGSMEDVVRAAIAKGFISLGISDHAPSVYESDFAIQPDQVEAYKQEFSRLKVKYGAQIELYLGIELDAFSEQPTDGLDYVIGSVHYLLDDGGNPHCVDYLAEMLEEGIRVIGGGDAKVFVAKYFDALYDMAVSRRPDIIGHMDCFVRRNACNRFFDVDSKWYHELCADAAARVADTGCIVELNTALVKKRPGRGIPYPSPFILERLAKEKAEVIISSDSHQADMLDFWFDEAEELLKRCGFRSIKQLRDGRFADVEL